MSIESSGENPATIESYDDLQSFLGRRVSMNDVLRSENGDTVEVRHDRPRIVGVLKEYEPEDLRNDDGTPWYCVEMDDGNQPWVNKKGNLFEARDIRLED